MRRIWRKLDARQGHPDAYSTQGVKRVLASLDRTLRHVLSSFSVANRRPRASYDLAGLPGLDSPTRERYWLGRGVPARTDTQQLNHLTSRWLTFHRGSDAPRGAELLLRLDLPGRAYGGAARAVVVRRSGDRTTHFISLGPAGNGREVLPFRAASPPRRARARQRRLAVQMLGGLELVVPGRAARRRPNVLVPRVAPLTAG